jgi:hypothetical protein
MFAFVLRTELQAEDAEHPVRVIASYSEDQVVPINTHGESCTRVTVPDSSVARTTPPIVGMPPFGHVLATGWRTDYMPIINAEASRRIELVFPDFKQRNATAAVQEWITTYGTNTTTWPAQCQAFKTEADRGWTYIQVIRDTANAFTSLPADPTADAIWPAPITPISFPPIPPI